MRARAAETRQCLSLALMREVARQLDARCLANEAGEAAVLDLS
jgi:hypothetical protein